VAIRPSSKKPIYRKGMSNREILLEEYSRILRVYMRTRPHLYSMSYPEQLALRLSAIENLVFDIKDPVLKIMCRNLNIPYTVSTIYNYLNGNYKLKTSEAARLPADT